MTRLPPITSHTADPVSAVAYRALSIRQPWAHAICQLGKRVENRNWHPGQALHHVGDLIAIHASLRPDPEAIHLLRSQGLEVPDKLTTGAVVAVARLVDLCLEESARRRYPTQDCWITGPLCLVFGGLLVLDRPVHVSGALGFWDLPERVRLDVSEQAYDRVDRDWPKWRAPGV